MSGTKGASDPSAASSAYGKQSKAGHRRGRLLPSWPVAMAGSIGWAVLMGASAGLELVASGWVASASIANVVLIFATGGLVGFPLGWAAARLISGGHGLERRLAAAFLCFSLATVGVTAAFYALEYRSYYAQWHDTAFSMTWMFQLLFTTIGATLQFAVSGLPLYFPLGFAGLAALSLWFARQPR